MIRVLAADTPFLKHHHLKIPHLAILEATLVENPLVLYLRCKVSKQLDEELKEKGEGLKYKVASVDLVWVAEVLELESKVLLGLWTRSAEANKKQQGS